MGNLLTLINPFFGCLIAWILLYQSDKREAFTVLGIECLSIGLHFVSVRMEGGLRTWYSKLFHSVALLPFFVTLIIMLVYPLDGYVSGGFLGEYNNLKNSINSYKDITKIANLIDRGAEQDTYCSSDVNFCFYK